MILAPSLYVYYTVIMTVWLYYNRNDGYYSFMIPWWMTAKAFIPDAVPLWVFSIAFFALMIALTFIALRVGERGMNILKTLPPILVALNPWHSNSLVKLRAQRQTLASEVKDVINTLGPTVFSDFDADILAANTFRSDVDQSRLKSIFSTEPQSRSRSRSRGRSWGFGLQTSPTSPKPLSSIDSKDNLRVVNRRIRDSMQGEEREGP